ncbi:hypothetical protein CspHIS471_0308440 [Cutaneotrichosporon sp. HIS471]|nr:hypothetical protein CspHIS471_0308440 [Cutaneotrichosporon sp. HIS471]
MGAVLSLPFFRRRNRRRRAPVSTPISHPRPLLRREDVDKTDEIQLDLVPKTHHSISLASMGSRIVRSASASSQTSRRTRRKPGDFGQETIPEVLEPKELSIPSLSSATASDSSCSSKPPLDIDPLPLLPLPLPIQAPRAGSVAGSKQRRRRASIRRTSTGTRRTSAKRRIESGWDMIRREEADGWAPAAGRAGGKRVRLAWPGA